MRQFLVACLLAFALGSRANPLDSSSSRKDTRVNNRIVGGHPIDIEEAPYQVALEELGILVCGGSIITPTQVLTAARCVFQSSHVLFKVRSGSSLLEQEGTLHNVTSSEYHSHYDPEHHDYDIAILTVDPPFEFDNTTSIIGLTLYEPLEGEVGTVSGWGLRDDDNIFRPTHLQSVDVPVVSRDRCSEENHEDITQRQICAGALNLDACTGDGGGPLIVRGALAGIVSWGKGCGVRYHPKIYTNVFILRPWIEERLVH